MQKYGTCFQTGTRCATRSRLTDFVRDVSSHICCTIPEQRAKQQFCHDYSLTTEYSEFVSIYYLSLILFWTKTRWNTNFGKWPMAWRLEPQNGYVEMCDHVWDCITSNSWFSIRIAYTLTIKYQKLNEIEWSESICPYVICLCVIVFFFLLLFGCKLPGKWTRKRRKTRSKPNYRVFGNPFKTLAVRVRAQLAIDHETVQWSWCPIHVFPIVRLYRMKMLSPLYVTTYVISLCRVHHGHLHGRELFAHHSEWFDHG